MLVWPLRNLFNQFCVDTEHDRGNRQIDCRNMPVDIRRLFGAMADQEPAPAKVNCGHLLFEAVLPERAIPALPSRDTESAASAYDRFKLQKPLAAERFESRIQEHEHHTANGTAQ